MRDNKLSQVHIALNAALMVGYEFDMDDFLAQKIQDRDMVGKKLLLHYICMITQIYLATRVKELPWID